VSGRLPVALRWREVVQHVPVEVAHRARKAAVEAGVDALVSIGGGSTTGLAKAVAMTTRLPIVAVPTTDAGSEATPVWGLTENQEKRTGTDPAVLPVTVIYDATLTLSLPVELSVASGFNGLAHCIDSMWAPGADPINSRSRWRGSGPISAGMPKVVTAPAGVDGRNQCLFGAYLSAVAFASAGSGLHHKICHLLGGAYDLPHAQTHAIVLPHVLAHNAPAVSDTAGRIAQALGAQPGPDADPARAAVTALLRLRDELDAPRALKDLGMAERHPPRGRPVPWFDPHQGRSSRSWARFSAATVAARGERCCKDEAVQSAGHGASCGRIRLRPATVGRSRPVAATAATAGAPRHAAHRRAHPPALRRSSPPTLTDRGPPSCTLRPQRPARPGQIH
jgi:alcohol dehydrogenase class IV